MQTKLTFTCSRSVTEASEKGVECVQNYNSKDTRTTFFTRFSSVSVTDFEQLNVCWEGHVIINMTHANP